MTIYNLPADLTADAIEDIQLVDYIVQNQYLTNKIRLDSHVFSFLTEGTKQLISQNHSVTIDRNQFLLIKAGNCLMRENLAPSNNYRSVLLFFSTQAVADFIDRNDLTVTVSQRTNPFLVGEHDPYTTNFVQGLHLLQSLSSAARSRILAAKFEEIMLYLLAKKGESFLRMLTGGSETVSQHPQFRRVVEANALNQLNVQEIAFLCNMSLSTFKRHFEKQYETSPIRWFQQKRLAHSAYLLTTTNKRPSDLYEEVGFESLSSYTQAFKQQFGLTPKQYQLQKMNV